MKRQTKKHQNKENHINKQYVIQNKRNKTESKTKNKCNIKMITQIKSIRLKT